MFFDKKLDDELAKYDSANGTSTRCDAKQKKIEIMDTPVKLIVMDFQHNGRMNVIPKNTFREANGAFIIYDVTD